MRSKVYIVSSLDSNAARYVYDFIFNTFFDTGIEWLSVNAELPQDSVVISHGVDGVKNSFFVPLNSFLKKPFPLHPSAIEIGSWNHLPTLFPAEGDVSFDLFSAIFYLLARVEEYAVSARDQHGRFKWNNSILSKSVFKEKPIVDLWLKKFGEVLQTKLPRFAPKVRVFEWVNTYDIDIAYAYSHRSPFRVLAATGKNVLSGDLSSLITRTKVLLKKKDDPFDTYAYQEKISTISHCRTVYFFLLGSGGKMDRNISPKNLKFQKLIQHVNGYADVGIHPSYLSGDIPEELTLEINHLRSILEKPVIQSRQHFLRMDLPITYRRLIREGITSDYTMGYAEQVGFRSGTCTPHFFFDLDLNEKTSLKIYPLTVMEGTLRDYLKLDAEQAKEAYKRLILCVHEVGGTFVSLWHNDSLKKDSAWRGVYQFMVDELNGIITQEGRVI